MCVCVSRVDAISSQLPVCSHQSVNMNEDKKSCQSLTQASHGKLTLLCTVVIKSTW